MLRGQHRSLVVSPIQYTSLSVNVLRDAPVMMASLPSKTLGGDMLYLMCLAVLTQKLFISYYNLLTSECHHHIAGQLQLCTPPFLIVQLSCGNGRTQAVCSQVHLRLSFHCRSGRGVSSQQHRIGCCSEEGA